MENIFFALQTDNQFKRQLQLLAYFNKKNKSVSIQQLSRVLSCSPPTLRSTINDLNLILPDQFKIEYKKRKGVKIIHPNYQSIDFAILELAKRTLPFQIINTLFHHQNMSLSKLEEKLFISESVLRSVINQINTVLKNFQISISINKLRFVGEEQDIRYFLYSFYSDFKNHFVEYNQDNPSNKIYMKLLESARQNNLRPMHYNYFQAVTWIQIITQRISSKNFSKLNEKARLIVLEHNSFPPFFKVFNEIFSRMFSNKHVLLEEAMSMYIISLHCIVYSETPADSFVYRREESQEIIEKINQFLASILPSELLNVSTTEKIQAFLINLRLLKYISPNFEKVSMPLKKYVKEANPKTYLKWYSYLKNDWKNIPFPISHCEDVAVSLTLFHSSIFSAKPLQNIFVLFSFRGESGFADYLVQTSKLILTDNVQAEYFFYEPITKQVIEMKKVDLVVCNYNLPLIENPPCPIVRLSYIPLALEWDKVRNTLRELM
ncbi:helix-turn-helix domain-containing protein [Listeria monocytogenes]|uniref:helix-turn-helix domain-containing protein n=1 Tax=Listeria monocytogenes TaxID=1639 RepID=UPI0015CD6C26|nr:helix-turn-helix domain-containing protein [Listeria monocytogenes]